MLILGSLYTTSYLSTAVQYACFSRRRHGAKILHTESRQDWVPIHSDHHFDPAAHRLHPFRLRRPDREQHPAHQDSRRDGADDLPGVVRQFPLPRPREGARWSNRSWGRSRKGGQWTSFGICYVKVNVTVLHRSPQPLTSTTSDWTSIQDRSIGLVLNCRSDSRDMDESSETESVKRAGDILIYEGFGQTI